MSDLTVDTDRGDCKPNDCFTERYARDFEVPVFIEMQVHPSSEYVSVLTSGHSDFVSEAAFDRVQEIAMEYFDVESLDALVETLDALLVVRVKFSAEAVEDVDVTYHGAFERPDGWEDMGLRLVSGGSKTHICSVESVRMVDVTDRDGAKVDETDAAETLCGRFYAGQMGALDEMKNGLAEERSLCGVCRQVMWSRADGEPTRVISSKD